MSSELTTRNRQLSTAETAAKVYLIDKNGKKYPVPTKRSRQTIESLHKTDPNDLSQTSIGKGLNIAKQSFEQSASSGLQIFSSISNSIQNLAKKSSEHKGIRSGILALVGGFFGLKSIKGLLSAPKILTNKDPNVQTAPLIIKAGKWFAGGSLALGALKALTGSGGITNPAIIVGALVFAAMHMITSGYENENSLTGKLLSMLGIKDDVKLLADDLKLDTLISS